MSLYKHVLAAVELDDTSTTVLKKAQGLAAAFGAQLSVLHVVEYVPIESGDALITAPVNLMQEMTAQAEQRLQALCTQHQVPPASARVRPGPIAGEILSCAKELGADLVVVGHPPRRGWLSLFNHTDEDVVAHAVCDVLALRLEIEKPK